jgi:hypothetical protein
MLIHSAEITGSVQLNNTDVSAITNVAGFATTASLNTLIVRTGSYASTSSVNELSSSINQVIKDKINAEGVISGSSQLTSSYDDRYVLSGSITQTTWDNIANKPAGIVSSSIQIIELGFATTSSVNDLQSVTGSYTSTSSFGAYSSSINTFTSSAATRLSTIESVTGSFATTGSNQFNGNQSISGSITSNGTITAQTLVVQTVTSSVEFVTGSTKNGSLAGNTHEFTGSVLMSGSLNVGSSATVAIGTSSDPAVIVSGNTSATISGNAKRLAQFRYNTADSTGIDLGYDATAGNGIIAGGTSANGAGIDFWTYNGSAWGNRVTINKSGSVGIGTTTPNNRLEVRNDTNGDLAFWINNRATTASGTSNSIIFGGYRDAEEAYAVGKISVLHSGGTSGDLNHAGSMVFYTQQANPSTLSERLRITNAGVVQPGANGTQDLGTSSLRWATIYTSDLSLSNGIGDYTIVEGENDLFLYNNKQNKVYKFVLAEVDPADATPKKS